MNQPAVYRSDTGPAGLGHTLSTHRVLRNTYSLLSMGDGLVSQIPALLMAVATGMIVTRSNASSDMGTTAAVQLTQSRPALMVAGIAAIIMAVIPGMPVFLFLGVGALLLFMGQRVKAAEQLTLSAVRHRDPALAWRAFATHPLVDSVTVAKSLLEGYRARIPGVAAAFA